MSRELTVAHAALCVEQAFHEVCRAHDLTAGESALVLARVSVSYAETLTRAEDPLRK